jgi:hypothetical protein
MALGFRHRIEQRAEFFLQLSQTAQQPGVAAPRCIGAWLLCRERW